MKRILITLLAIVLVANFAFSAEGAAAEPASQPEASQPAPEAAPAAAKKPKVKVDIFGSVRYRFQYENSQSAIVNDNGSIGDSTGVATRRERQRIKVQFGAMAQIGDQVELKIVLSTGSTSNTRSVNQTLGTASNNKTGEESDNRLDSFGLYSIGIYEADLKLKFLSNMLQLGFGKFKAPHYSAGLVLHSDVRPDGMYQTLDIKLGNMNIGLNLGEWITISDVSGGADPKTKFSKWIIAPQLFWKAKFGMVELVLAPGMYLWTNRNRGNGENLYSLFNVYLELGFKLAIPIKLKFEMSMNMSKNEYLAGNALPVNYTDAVKNNKIGFLVELSAGSVKKQWDWELKVGFLYAQLYAVNPAIANDDFFKVTADNTAKTYLNAVMPSSVPMGLYISAGLGVLDNTKLSIDFIVFQRTYISTWATTGKAEKGWILKMSLEAKF